MIIGPYFSSENSCWVRYRQDQNKELVVETASEPNGKWELLNHRGLNVHVTSIPSFNPKQGVKRARPEATASQKELSTKAPPSKRLRPSVTSQTEVDVFFDEIKACFENIYLLMRSSQSKQQRLEFQRKVFAAFQLLTDLSKNESSKFYKLTDSFPSRQRAQRIAFFLYNSGKLASNIKKSPQLPSALIEFFLSLVLASQPTNKALTNSLQGIGALAKANAIAGKLNSEHLVFALNKLLTLDGLIPQAISNSFNCLGYSAQAKCLEGAIDPVLLSNALRRLLTFNTLLLPQHIANALNSLGYLAQANCLADPIDSALLSQAMTKLLTLDYLDSQAIANSLNGVGYLARANSLTAAFDPALLSEALTKLLTLDDLRAQNIANSLNGLGYLAQAKYLDGAIDSALLNDLLRKFISLNDTHAQHIANSLNSLGYLARANCVAGPIDSALLSETLTRLLTLDDLRAQAISNSLNGLGYLAQANCLTAAIDPALLSEALTKLLTLDDLRAQTIANSLNGLGYLAQANCLTAGIESALLSEALTMLLTLDDLQAQNIANSLNDLGYLAQAEYLTDTIDPVLLSHALSKLLTLDALRAQHIANSLNGLGYLAQTNCLTAAIDTVLLSETLTKLLTLDDLQAQNIANTLNGLGYLAQAECLADTIDSVLFNEALSKLLNLDDLDAQAISNSLNGLGNLAKKQRLAGPIDSGLLSEALSKLLNLSNLDAQAISNSLNSIGYLVRANCLAGVIDSAILSEALRKILTLDNLDPQAIGISLNSLGYLAKAQRLVDPIDSALVSEALSRLLTLDDLDPQAISNSLNGLGYLAQEQYLAGVIDPVMLSKALSKLLTLDNLKPQSIANSLTSLGNLAKTQRLAGPIDSAILCKTFSKLLTLDNLEPQAISNSLNGLGYLAQAQSLTGAIDSRILTQTLTHLLTLNDLSARDIANSFCSLGRLQARGFLTAPLPSKPFKQSATKLLTCKLIPLDLVQTLEHWTTFIRPDDKEGFELFIRLADKALHSAYLHPTLALRLLPSLVAYKNSINDERLDALYHELLSFITIPFKRFPASAQVSLNHCLTALKAQPSWHYSLSKNLSLAPQSTFNSETESSHSMTESAVETEVETEEEEEHIISTRGAKQTRRANRDPNSFFRTRATEVVNLRATRHWHKASQNSLFRAIQSNDEKGLKRLLDLSGINYSSSSSVKSKAVTTTGSSSRASSMKTQGSAAGLVNQFFHELPSSALKILIAQSEAKYFYWLFRACTIHERYQLCQSTAVYVLWQNLPLNELTTLIKMLKPTAIYRDHHALIHLMDALTIRLAQKLAEKEGLLSLQKELLDEGIRFHVKCKHIHVVPRLKTLLREVGRNNARLLDNESLQREEEAESLPVSIPASRPTIRPPLQQNLVAAVQSASPVISPGLFQPSVAAARRQGPGPKNYYAVNQRYFYEAEDIDKILEYRLKALKDPSIVRLAGVELEGVRGACIAAALSSWKHHAYLAPDSDTKVVIPINDTGRNHWVGIQINFKGTQITELLYFDGYLSNEDQRQELKAIHQDLVAANLITKQTRIKIAPAIKQPDGSSCGALVVENLYCFNKGMSWPSDLENIAKNIRERHLSLLKQEDTHFFHQFGQKQEENRSTVPSREEQVRTHGLC